MGFFEDVVGYFFAWFVWATSFGGMFACLASGSLSLVFADDDGLWTEECNKLYNGFAVDFTEVTKYESA